MPIDTQSDLMVEREFRAAPVENDRLIRALLRRPLDATPIWLMRQAGRYLPEYRETRRRAGDFMTLCKTPDLACEVTLQPIERFPLDAAILFSDILTIPDAMGLGLSVQEGVGPRFERPVRSGAEIRALGVPDPEDRLRYVMDAVRQSRRALAGRVPLIGFAGSPWTLATYMVEGGTGHDFRRVKGLDVRGAATAARAARQAGAGGDGVSQGPGRGRRPGAHGLRYLGRGAVHARL